MVMTGAQALVEQGRKEGKEKGHKEGRNEGRADEARRILLRQGSRKFGPADSQTEAAIRSIKSIRRLEQLTDYLLDVSDWTTLLSQDQ